jgi:hypothetical protein
LSAGEARLRRLLLLVLLLGVLGTSADLLLIGHYEDRWQLLPLVALGAGLVALAWHVATGSVASARALQAVMFGLIAAGGAGVALHHGGAREFALETDPSLRGVRLFWKVMRAKAPPALAPASMIPLGLVGLAFASLRPTSTKEE